MVETAVSISAVLMLGSLAAYQLFRGRSVAAFSQGLVLGLLALVEALDRLALGSAGDPLALKKAAVVAESLLPFSLMAFGLTFARPRLSLWAVPQGLLAAAALAFPAAALLMPLDSLFFAPDLRSERLLFLGRGGYWFYMGLMAYCVLALINVEATLASSRGKDRWKIKFEAIGAAAMVAALILYYSQGLLYRTINMGMVSFRAGVFTVAALAMGYSKIFRGNNVRIALSRHVIYKSVSLLVVGLYLLALGLVGGGMRYFDVPAGRGLTLFIAFASGMAVVLVLFSERLRRRAKVFISEHFYAQKHDYREEWLKFTARLASCKTMVQLHDVILSAFMGAFGMESGALYLLDREGARFARAAKREMPDSGVRVASSSGLAGYFRGGGILLAGEDDYAPADDEAAFLRETGARLLIPLPEDGGVMGFVALGRQVAPEEFIHEDLELMKTLARQAALAIRNFTLSEDLAEAREMAAMAKVSSFVAHDLKNLASSLSLVLENAEDYISEPDFQRDMVRTVRNTVDKMTALMRRLRAMPEKQSLRMERADLASLARESLEEVRAKKSGIEYSSSWSEAVAEVDVEEMRKVLLNLLLNAVEAVNGSGSIRVETGCKGEAAFIRVEDSGPGMSEEYQREHLFRPFRTTKEKGLGIGLYQCRQIMEAHGGRIEVRSGPGEGSAFTVYLPVERASAGNVEYLPSR
ncbi:MAG: PEP-CTERM system histidine kinase PrsK [Thermodesulfovibrionales bacterium]